MRIPTAIVFTMLAAGTFNVQGADAQGPPLVSLKDGTIEYHKTDKGDQIPDFSFAGYRGGGVALPEVPVKLTLAPAEQGDDTERIQKAIDQVSALPLDPNGHRGALLLNAGTYRVAETLYIRVSGVVLRGEGPREGGTLIMATGTKQRSVIVVGGGKPGQRIQESRKVVADPLVPVGSRRLTLDSTNGLAVGDEIAVVRQTNDAWINKLGMKAIGWKAAEYCLDYERRIVECTPTTVTIDAPIVFSIDTAYGGGSVYKLTPDTRIREVAVENLRMDSAYAKGQEDKDEAHAWTAVQIENAVDGWVRDVTSVHFGYSCVYLRSGAAQITVQDSACLDPVSICTGGRRYSFAQSGQRCLVQRCFTRGGRHDYVMHARVRGPNVFLDCVATRTHSDSGPHHRWSNGTLYDNIACGALVVQNRGHMGTGHGWAGATTVFWNCRAYGIGCHAPPTANNYSIGCIAKKGIGGSGHIESPGKPVEPRSLYLVQLKQRLGEKAVQNVTTEAQRKGTLDEWLQATLSR